MSFFSAFFTGLRLSRMFCSTPAKRPGALEGQVWQGSVVRVLDGDTIWADFGKGELRIRFAHIDAPEHGQRMGDVSQTWLSKVLPVGSTVTVYPKEIDCYGRVVADVHYGDSWLNYWLVRTGMAWALPNDESTMIAEAMLAAQQERTGLWVDRYPTAPWDFRKQCLDGLN